MNRQAIIIGATGLVGKTLLGELSALYQKVIVIARQHPSTMPVNVAYYQLNDFADMAQTMNHINLDANTDAFSCLGTTRKQAGNKTAFKDIDFGYNFSFAQQCKSKGVQRFFLLSAHGADARSRLFYNQIKGELEEALIALGFAQLVIFRPSLLLGKHKGRPLERLAQISYQTIAPAISVPLATKPIQAWRVAGSMVMMAQRIHEQCRYQSSRLGHLPKNATSVTIIDNKNIHRMTQTP